MNEEDVKAKWCPMAREIDKSSNGVVAHNHNTKCIASDCMMWVEEMEINVSSGMRSVCGGHCGLTR